MKNKIIGFLKYIFVFVGLFFVFNLALFLVCSFDSELVRKNVAGSLKDLEKQGMFYLISETLDITNNNCTDSVILNEAYSVDYKHPFISYMKARKNYKEGQTTKELLETTGEGVTVNYDEETNKESNKFLYDPIDELKDFLNGKVHMSINYGRYWHGYLLLYRPLLVLLNLSQIRFVLFVLYVLLFGYFIYLLKKRFHTNIALIFGLSLVFSGYFSASVSLESSPIFLTMMISSIILLKRIDTIKNFGLFLFMVACISNYFDYLTVPLITLGIPCAIYLLKLIEEKKDWKYCLKFMIVNSLIWLIGYAATWICKWAWYDIMIHDGNHMLKIGFTQSFYRMTRINETNIGANYVRVASYVIGKSSLYSIISLFILLIVNRFKVHSEGFNKVAFSSLLLSIYSVSWYLILANHTILHYYFTYRQTVLYMIGLLLSFYILFLNPEKKNPKKKD